ncbi:MAG: amidohydrolase family protein [Chloroflexi bacterium]|nr:amidohydrolase family protein [Chloroflexota bacterium]
MSTPVIDADAHVIETDRTWEFMREEDAAHKPQVLVPRDGGPDEYWLVEGRAFRRNANVGDDTSPETREASDIAKRLAHMDEMGVDVHVLYPSFFLTARTHHADTDYALARAYNRWLADIWAQGGGRLRWAVIPPLFSMERAIEEIRFGKEHGACAVFMRGIEGDHRLSDPYMFPLYEEAIDLDMPICVHAAAGSMPAFDVVDRDFGFSKFKLPAVGAFHDLIMQGTPQRFPELRWGFIEISASWLPYAMNDLALRFARQKRDWPGEDVLRENNMWVACQTADDLAYVIACAGDDHIVIGTDYGHNDTATEILALRNLRDGGKVSAATADKILGVNAERLYAL